MAFNTSKATMKGERNSIARLSSSPALNAFWKMIIHLNAVSSAISDIAFNYSQILIFDFNYISGLLLIRIRTPRQCWILFISRHCSYIDGNHRCGIWAMIKGCGFSITTIRSRIRWINYRFALNQSCIRQDKRHIALCYRYSLPIGCGLLQPIITSAKTAQHILIIPE
jgi:hypothetical protein